MGFTQPREFLARELQNGTKFFEKFKAFIRRGNVVDLAVGVIIGGAFGKIVSSLVSDILMPPIGLLLARLDFRHLKWTLQEARGNEPAVTINYGVFLSTALDFILVAAVIFVVVELLHRLWRTPEPPPPSMKECPYCATNIPMKAVRCPQCISDLGKPADEPAVYK